MDATDRAIINSLQGGFPLCREPYARIAQELKIGEKELIARLETLLDNGTLSRFGPMYHAERMGGALTLAALSVPEDDFARIADIVNAYPEVAHNYQREHALNMWFVLATESLERQKEVLDDIAAKTGLRVYNMPKIEEFFIGARFAA